MNAGTRGTAAVHAREAKGYCYDNVGFILDCYVKAYEEPRGAHERARLVPQAGTARNHRQERPDL